MSNKRSKTFLNLDRCLDQHRISLSAWNLLLIPYIPFGLLLLVFRLCLIPQALIMMVLIPHGRAKRVLLWIYFIVMGLVVVNKNFERRARSSRMLVSNHVSHFDYIPLHISLECTTTSTGVSKPLLSFLFYHHVFVGSDSKDIQEEVKKLPEFDDSASIPDSAVIPYIAQPEPLPTNGKGVLKFTVWPFTAEETVQPIAISCWRPLDICLTTAYSSEWSDLLWMMITPFTIFTVKMLPLVESRDDLTHEQFARKTQDQIAKSLDVVSIQATLSDIKKWKEDLEKVAQPKDVLRSNDVTGPIILESDFSGVKSSPEIEHMVQQVLTVLPHVPHHVIRKDISRTRSVDVTVTNILEGRVNIVTRRPPQNENLITQTYTSLPSSKKSRAFTIQDCNRTFHERKKDLIEQSRRRYMTKHGLSD